MLYLILTLEIALAIFLLGVLGIALAVTLRHGDPSATYGLYAVRDKLIDACVFKGISRANPWLDSLYENVNAVLVHSNMLSGPARWSFALAVGHYQASHPSAAGKLKPFPHDPRRCPEPIRALIPEIRTALERLSGRHIGVMLQMNAREREERRIQRESQAAIADDARRPPLGLRRLTVTPGNAWQMSTEHAALWKGILALRKGMLRWRHSHYPAK